MVFQPIFTSIRIFFLTLLFSIPLACVITIFRVRRILILSSVIRAFIVVIRGTPLILQLLFFYFGPPAILHMSIDRFTSVIVAFSINYAAYFAEIFRSGYISLPRGQFEACKILGLSKTFSFFHVYVPQIVKRITPAFSGEVVTLVKDTALASALGIAELFTFAQKRTQAEVSIMPVAWAGVFYFAFNCVVAFVFWMIEKRFDRYKI